MRLPTDGIYPVATIAIAGLAFGLAEVAHGSGFLAVYLTALALGSARIPARRTIVAFHEGVGWVAQIGLFILLGLLVFPSTLGDVALESLALSAVLIVIARPLAALLATVFAPLNLRERAMLGWAGLRGATPIWLATFPVVAGVGTGQELFSIVFFVVVTSTLVQGATFEPLASRLGLTTDEPALPRRLLESGRIRRLGGDVISYRLKPGAAAAGHLVRELGLPREALVNVIVRDGRRDPAARLDRAARGRRAARPRPRRAARGGRAADPALERGPIGVPPPPLLPPRGSPQVFSVRPVRDDGDDPSAPDDVGGIPVVAVLRSRRERPSALVALADGRYSVVTEGVVAVGGRQALAQLVRAAGGSRRRRSGREGLVAGGHRRPDRPRADDPALVRTSNGLSGCGNRRVGNRRVGSAEDR